MVSAENLKKLPDAPGVYLFKNKAGDIMYVGKATSLKSRVKSYFAGNLDETRGQLIVQMVNLADKVDFVQTDSVLEALILEAKLIKEHQPYHNTKEKDDKSFNHVVITNEQFPRVLVVRGRELEKKFTDPKQIKEMFGPFPNGSALREAMKIIRRIFPYRDKCTPAVELPPGKPIRPCFEKQIGLCPGVCTGETSEKEYKQTIKHLTMFFEGRKKQLLASLEREMKAFAKAEEFEKAAQVRRTLFALRHIQDVALIRREKSDAQRGTAQDGVLTATNTRIEAYDIAHMAGKSTAGVMVVVEDGEKTNSEYRMFKIRGQTNGDDLKALAEVLTRRFTHTEWQMPAVIVIDGGETHLKYAREVLEKSNIHIPTVAVVKGSDHKAKDIIGDSVAIEAHKADILLANTEAHRFAIKYHKNLRGKAFFS